MLSPVTLVIGSEKLVEFYTRLKNITHCKAFFLFYTKKTKTCGFLGKIPLTRLCSIKVSIPVAEDVDFIALQRNLSYKNLGFLSRMSLLFDFKNKKVLKKLFRVWVSRDILWN